VPPNLASRGQAPARATTSSALNFAGTPYELDGIEMVKKINASDPTLIGLTSGPSLKIGGG
jgi:hypothetical protein